jgi:hypothetical protein
MGGLDGLGRIGNMERFRFTVKISSSYLFIMTYGNKWARFSSFSRGYGWNCGEKKDLRNALQRANYGEFDELRGFRAVCAQSLAESRSACGGDKRVNIHRLDHGGHDLLRLSLVALE